MYQLKQNDKVLAEGSFADCWKAILHDFADKSVQECFEMGLHIIKV